MQKKVGRDRIVFTIPSLGIVIKLPIFHFYHAIRPFFRSDIKKMKKWVYLKKWISWPVEIRDGFRGLLFGGLVANLNEFVFYWSTRNPFLQPTYFTFFGLLNIQQFDRPCELDSTDLWCQLYELTDGEVFADGHHFSNPDNFCFHNGKLRMLDYGSKPTCGVVTVYGRKIVELLNPAYNWEEEKKKLKK